MTIAPGYVELHRAVDRLSPQQATAVFGVVAAMVSDPASSPAAEPVGRSGRRHRLSFTAAGRGPSDLAERAEEYLQVGDFGTASV